jgi:HK97 family phage prohead protease
MNKETRMLNVEFRALDNDEDKMIVEGYAITFNSPATHWGMTEVINERALDNCDMSDVPLKYNHDDSHLIMARTRNGSLVLEKDSIGLKIRAELIDTQSNKDIYKSIKAGLLDKMSFAFTVKEEQYDFDTDTRTILNIDKLFDVSIVDTPYYDSTSVFARKLDNSQEYVDKINMEKRKKLAEKLARQELLNRL